MKCSKCGKKMVVKRRDTSSDSRNGKKYDRTAYWCKKDDVWAQTEVPKAKRVSKT